MLDFFRQAYTQDATRLAEGVEEIRRHGRERAKGLLDLMLRWVRDLILVRTLGPEEAPLVNVDQAKLPSASAKTSPRPTSKPWRG